MARNGDHYWDFAHVMPSFDAKGEMIGYNSNRRVPDREMIETAIIPLYAEVLKFERSQVNGKDVLQAGYKAFTDFVASQKVADEELNLYSLEKALLSITVAICGSVVASAVHLSGYQADAVAIQAIAIASSGLAMLWIANTARLTRQAKDLCKRIAAGDLEARIPLIRRMIAWPSCTG
jgi:hypothetical protein